MQNLQYETEKKCLALSSKIICCGYKGMCSVGSVNSMFPDSLDYVGSPLFSHLVEILFLDFQVSNVKVQQQFRMKNSTIITF